MNRIIYKGYQIEPIPYQLAESGEWTMNIHILRDRGNEIRVRPFFARNRFKTEEEAIEHCFYFGKQIIDGQIENCSVDDL
jgi:hypothetical protein